MGVFLSRPVILFPGLHLFLFDESFSSQAVPWILSRGEVTWDTLGRMGDTCPPRAHTVYQARFQAPSDAGGRGRWSFCAHEACPQIREKQTLRRIRTKPQCLVFTSSCRKSREPRGCNEGFQ